jgi:hypothetical protein
VHNLTLDEPNRLTVSCYSNCGKTNQKLLGIMQ